MGAVKVKDVDTSRVVEVDANGCVSLDGLRQARHDRYLVTAAQDGTLVFSPALGWTEHDSALQDRPDILRLLDEDRSRLVPLPIDSTPETAEDDMAYLAVFRARHAEDEDRHETADPHPCFDAAVAAARQALDEESAFLAAKAALGRRPPT